MRLSSVLLALNVWAAAVFGQPATDPNVTRVVHFNYISSDPGFKQMITVIRTVADVPNSLDADAKTLTLTAPPDRVAMAEWLVSELDRPAKPTPAPATYKGSIPGHSDYAMKVFYVANDATDSGINDLVTAIRTVADVTRLFSVASASALVMCGPADKVALAEWLWHELDQPGQPYAGTTNHEYLMTGDHPDVTRIFYAANINTMKGLVETVTALRTVADVTRMFPINAHEAIVMRGPAENVALAEWVFHQLDQPAAGPHATPSPAQYQLPGTVDNTAKVFYLAHTDAGQPVGDIASAIRAGTHASRIFYLTSLGAVTMRGTEAQIAQAAQLIQNRDKAMQ